MFARKVFVEKTAVWMLSMKGSKLAYVVLVDEASKEVLTLIISEPIRGKRNLDRFLLAWESIQVYPPQESSPTPSTPVSHPISLLQ